VTAPAAVGTIDLEPARLCRQIESGQAAPFGDLLRHGVRADIDQRRDLHRIDSGVELNQP